MNLSVDSEEIAARNRFSVAVDALDALGYVLRVQQGDGGYFSADHKDGQMGCRFDRIEDVEQFIADENARRSAVAAEKSQVMGFGGALAALKAGAKVARAGWNGDGMFVYLVPGSTFAVNRAPLLGIYPEGTPINYRPHIDMRTADGSCVPWLASHADLLADDWSVIP